jgi:hypothetical protein
MISDHQHSAPPPPPHAACIPGMEANLHVTQWVICSVDVVRLASCLLMTWETAQGHSARIHKAPATNSTHAHSAPPNPETWTLYPPMRPCLRLQPIIPRTRNSALTLGIGEPLPCQGAAAWRTKRRSPPTQQTTTFSRTSPPILHSTTLAGPNSN